MRDHRQVVVPLVLLMGLTLPVAEAEDVAVEAKNVVVVEVDAVQVGDGAGNVVVQGNAAGFQVQVQAGQVRLQQVQPAVPQRAAEAAAAPGGDDPQAVLRARQQQEQAKQFESLLQKMLRAELEKARATCGSLAPAARRQVLTAGRDAVKTASVELAARQMAGRPGRFDVRQQLREALRESLKSHVTTAELAAYDAEETLRDERRAGAARVQIIAKLDQELDLSEGQRKAIEEHLARAWNTDWIRELDDAGHVINDRRLAPDYAEVAIVPHLDPGQKDEWKAWCRVAGSRILGVHRWQSWQWTNEGLIQPDPWWGP